LTEHKYSLLGECYIGSEYTYKPNRDAASLLPQAKTPQLCRIILCPTTLWALIE
jgi:hypothetical protein